MVKYVGAYIFSTFEKIDPKIDNYVMIIDVDGYSS